MISGKTMNLARALWIPLVFSSETIIFISSGLSVPENEKMKT
jgi:hypothetical protein